MQKKIRRTIRFQFSQQKTKYVTNAAGNVNQKLTISKLNSEKNLPSQSN